MPCNAAVRRGGLRALYQTKLTKLTRRCGAAVFELFTKEERRAELLVQGLESEVSALCAHPSAPQVPCPLPRGASLSTDAPHTHTRILSVGLLVSASPAPPLSQPGADAPPDTWQVFLTTVGAANGSGGMLRILDYETQVPSDEFRV